MRASMEFRTAMRTSSRAGCQVSFHARKSCNKLIVRFVEDRSYKLLIVDSIMNLFRQSAQRSVERHQLMNRTRLLRSRRTVGATTGKLSFLFLRVGLS